ncbi:MAG TPA: aldo/keto reductase [Solirubrobacterales bacterium]|nr:aldo/keto reductase [Solirubrobacterales bacterium]
MTELGRAAIGTWSGGRYMRFGEAISDGRLEALFRPGEGIDTVITADVYGEGEADRTLGRALAGMTRDSYRIAGAIGHDYIHGERQGPKGFPRFTHPSLRGPDGYASYLCEATEASLGAVGIDRFDVLLLHNPDRTGYESEAVWEGMAALRDAGLADTIGIAPGPANGFTLDLIACLERFGEVIDWAMVILNPLEPWPGELVLDAAATANVSVITRVVDYGGLFWGDLTASTPMHEHDHRRFRPDGWVERGIERIERMRPIATGAGLTDIQLACAWNLAHPAVACVAPTLIQEAGEDARPIEDKRAELAALPIEGRLEPEAVAAIREIGDNTGSMKLKGSSPEHEGEDAPDRWGLSEELTAVGERHGIAPDRDLAYAG